MRSIAHLITININKYLLNIARNICASLTTVSCSIPLWNILIQESKEHVTTIHYADQTCGIYFTAAAEFLSMF